MRPTGDLHLGHLCGALKNWRRLQQTHDCFYFVADWHALTTDYKNPGALSKTAREMVITWLAVGIDPEKSVIFKQSDTPAHAELFVLLSMICPLPWLTRLPTYKEQQENLQRDLDTHGFLATRCCKAPTYCPTAPIPCRLEKTNCRTLNLPEKSRAASTIFTDGTKISSRMCKMRLAHCRLIPSKQLMKSAAKCDKAEKC